jgi:hypothetical protein
MFKIERLESKREKKKKRSFGSNKTKGPKQDSQNLIRSPISEGGESLLN